MRNIDNLIKRYEKLTGYEEAATEDFCGNASFYLLPDGRFLNCNCEYGSRGDDHRLIFGATRINSNDYYKFDKLHRNYKVVRLIPESNMALIGKRQQLTREQERALDGLDYEVERY